MNSIPISRVVETMTLNIKIHGIKRFRVRLWLAAKCFRLGARLIGCKVNMEIE